MKLDGTRKLLLTLMSTAALRLKPTSIAPPKRFRRKVRYRRMRLLSKNKAKKILLSLPPAAWDFIEKHKNDIAWDFVAICPSYVYGPILHELSSPENLNETMHEFAEVVFKGAHRPAGYQSSWIDVRDVGRAHALAFEKTEVGGKRFLLSGGMHVWQDFCEIPSEFF